MKKYIALALLPLLCSFASIGGLNMNDLENYDISSSYTTLAYQAYHNTVQRAAPLPVAISSIQIQAAFQSADYLDFISHSMSAESQVDYRRHYPDGRIILKVFAPTLYAVNRPATLSISAAAPVVFAASLVPNHPSWETEAVAERSGYTKYLIYNLDDHRPGNAFDQAQEFQLQVNMTYPGALPHSFTVSQ